MDNEEGNDLVFVNGMAWVNRIYYIVCEVPYENGIDYEVCDA